MASRTMVFGDDGSPSADLAWLWINSHSWPDWRLEVIHAKDPVVVNASAQPSEAHPWFPMIPRRASTDAQLEEVEFLTIDADPRVALLRPADVLVIGPRGRGLWKALHVGSTAEWLMAHPPSPMVIVQHGRPTRSVVVCHDGSANACAATRALCLTPWVHELIVTVVAVKDGRADVERGIESATGSLERVGARVHSRVLHGEPNDQLLTYLGEHQPDLVVLGGSTVTGMKRLTVESPAKVVTHNAQFSVLLACEEPEKVMTEASSDFRASTTHCRT